MARVFSLKAACAVSLLLVASYVGWAASSAPARPSASTASVVRHCGRGSVEEYPYFDIKALHTNCKVARTLIRRFLTRNAPPGHCDRGVCWSVTGNILHGRWTTRTGWHCTARIPPALYIDGRPYGSELCVRGAGRVSALSYG